MSRRLLVGWIIRMAVITAILGTPAMASQSLANKQQLKIVEAKHVCMVNDTYFARDQIPVKLGEETYYGCCAMCKEKITQSKEIRQAIDPVSGKAVDKAKAVIGAEESGKVFYFENKENLAKYSAK